MRFISARSNREWQPGQTGNGGPVKPGMAARSNRNTEPKHATKIHESLKMKNA
ncbi:MAG: hypothetical protein GY757_15415 [bacterium]|nr:hypothetical protein [bacterium]